MAPLRRQTDEDDGDYRRMRSGGQLFNGHTTWVIRVVSAGLVAALGWLLINDRDGFEERQRNLQHEVSEVRRLSLETSKALEVHQQTSGIVWQDIRRTLDEIKADVKEVKRRR